MNIMVRDFGDTAVKKGAIFMDFTDNIMLERRKLIRAFNKLKKNHIIAVCAPAGYGKTVAVTQWLEKDTRAKAVLSVDEHDNNLAGFCKRFCVALCTCQPQNKTLNEIISHSSFQSAPDEFTVRAVDALSGRKQAVLAIDDLHLIHNDEVLKLLLTFIKRLPKNFSLILISRNDLPTEFSDLWLKGHIAGINAEQFFFNKAEVKALYDMRGSRITNESAEDISTKTQGRAIGINAFMLSGGNFFDKTYDYLDDFIQTNIWEKWDDTTRDFMLCTAGLRELTPSVCESMTGVIPARKFLRELVKKGAFITQVQDDIFHYHHLFRQFLRKKADEKGEKFVHSLLEKEGNWHLLQNDFCSAIDCFVRCKNHEGIDKGYGLLETVSIHSSYSVERLLHIFKHNEVQLAAEKYPRLLFMLFWCALIEGRADDAIFFIDKAYARWPEVALRHPASANNILYIRLMDFRISKLRMMREVTTLPDTYGDFYLATPARLGWSVNMPQLYRGTVDLSDLTVGGVIENFTVLRPQMPKFFGEGASMLTEIIISGLSYEQGDLENAHKYALSALSEMKSYFTPESQFCAMSTLVMVSDALGDSEEANQTFEALSKMIEDNKAYYLTSNFKAFTARRKFVDIKIAEEWLAGQTVTEPTLCGIYIAFTTCRAYISVGKYDAAIILLKKILKLSTSFDRPLDIIEAHILSAIAHWKKKLAYQNEALKHLETAVFTAFRHGYVQMFINDGAVLSGMLHKLKKRTEHKKEADANVINFIKMIYLKTRPLSADTKLPEGEKITKLTNRQREVTALLCQGKRYKEVAESLGIKQSTVISHIELIYNKLNVTNLPDCVAKVSAMRLLEPDNDEDA